VGERRLTDPSETPAVRWSAFAVFGVVAVAAAVGALFELFYYTTTPALAPATLGTVIGICGALIGFFVWGLTAPPNE
jgi:hypothetical protein